MSTSRGKKNQGVIFWVQRFFQILTGLKILNSKSNALCFFQSKIWRVVKVLFQSLTLCFFLFLNLTRSNIFMQTLLLKPSFQILAELLSKCYQQRILTCWNMTMAWGKKFFYECVACVCLTFGTFFLVIGSCMAIGFFMVWLLYQLHYQLIYTNIFAFQKMVSLQKNF